jgi:hypothetical protein
MNGQQGKEEWLKLCEQAAAEKDPEKLVALTREICRLLEERENAIKKNGAPSHDGKPPSRPEGLA